VLVPFRTRSNQLEAVWQFGSVTEGAVERRTESRLPPLGVECPRSGLEWWTVADVLAMTAGELSDPLAFLVTVVTGDRSLHQTRVSA
jgi:hypothetical protein